MKKAGITLPCSVSVLTTLSRAFERTHRVVPTATTLPPFCFLWLIIWAFRADAHHSLEDVMPFGSSSVTGAKVSIDMQVNFASHTLLL
jgi:hypothetical protein